MSIALWLLLMAFLCYTHGAGRLGGGTDSSLIDNSGGDDNDEENDFRLVRVRLGHPLHIKCPTPSDSIGPSPDLLLIWSFQLLIESMEPSSNDGKTTLTYSRSSETVELAICRPPRECKQKFTLPSLAISASGQLDITRTSMEHSGQYSCTVIQGVGTKITGFNVIVEERPEEAKLSIQYSQQGRQIVAQEGIEALLTQGQSFTVLCSTRKIYPLPTLSIFVGGRDSTSSSHEEVGVMRFHADPFYQRESNRLLVSITLTANWTFHAKSMRCEVASTGGSVKSNPIYFNVTYVPLIANFTHNPWTIVVDELETIQCRARGNPQPKLSWLLSNGKQLLTEGGEISSQTLITAIEPTMRHYPQSVVLTCQAVNQLGQSERQLQVQLQHAPLVETNKLVFTHVGQVLRIWCQVRANPPVDTITWFHQPLETTSSSLAGSRENITNQHQLDKLIGGPDDHRALIKSTGPLLLIDPVKPSDSGLYTCVAVNTVRRSRTRGEGDTRRGWNTTIINVYHVPGEPRIVSDPIDGNVLIGTSVQLECRLNKSEPGLPPPTIKWTMTSPYNQARRLLEHTGSRLQVTILNATHDAGLYYCTASNKLGSSISQSINLLVVEPPIFVGEPLPLLIEHRPDSSQPIHLECVVRGHPMPRIEWLHNDKTLTIVDHRRQDERSQEANGRGQKIIGPYYNITTTIEPMHRDGQLPSWRIPSAWKTTSRLDLKVTPSDDHYKYGSSSATTVNHPFQHHKTSKSTSKRLHGELTGIYTCRTTSNTIVHTERMPLHRSISQSTRVMFIYPPKLMHQQSTYQSVGATSSIAAQPPRVTDSTEPTSIHDGYLNDRAVDVGVSRRRSYTATNNNETITIGCYFQANPAIEHVTWSRLQTIIGIDNPSRCNVDSSDCTCETSGSTSSTRLAHWQRSPTSTNRNRVFTSPPTNNTDLVGQADLIQVLREEDRVKDHEGLVDNSTRQLSMARLTLKSGSLIKNNLIGSYLGSVKSTEGCDYCFVDLVNESVPWEPQLLRLEHLLVNSVDLIWKPGFDGGHQQDFIVSIEEVSEGSTASSDRYELGIGVLRDRRSHRAMLESSLQCHRITGLLPLKIYSVAMYARNLMGRGPSSVNINFSTPAPNLPVISKHLIEGSSLLLEFTNPIDWSKHCLSADYLSNDQWSNFYNSCQMPVPISPVNNTFEIDQCTHESDSNYSNETDSISQTRVIRLESPVELKGNTLRVFICTNSSSFQLPRQCNESRLGRDSSTSAWLGSTTGLVSAVIGLILCALLLTLLIAVWFSLTRRKRRRSMRQSTSRESTYYSSQPPCSSSDRCEGLLDSRTTLKNNNQTMNQFDTTFQPPHCQSTTKQHNSPPILVSQGRQNQSIETVESCTSSPQLVPSAMSPPPLLLTSTDPGGTHLINSSSSNSNNLTPSTIPFNPNSFILIPISTFATNDNQNVIISQNE